MSVKLEAQDNVVRFHLPSLLGLDRGSGGCEIVRRVEVVAWIERRELQLMNAIQKGLER